MGDPPASDAAPSHRFVTQPPDPVSILDPGAVLVLGPGRATGAGRVPIAIYGGGGHSAQCIDLLRGLDGPDADCVLDDSLPPGSDVLGVPVIGGASELASLDDRGVRLAVNAVGGIASPDARARVFDLLADAGLTLPVIVHTSASIEPSALVAPGAQVFAQAYVGTRAVIGAGSLLNAGVVVSHDCVLEAGANVSPGALLAGDVHLGRLTRIGMGATVNVGLRIGHGARVGNGATVKADVPDGGVVRAGRIWPE
jgi:sugar O-acyltransferase (sialic acid O-acetyltransferase NeuD family)